MVDGRTSKHGYIISSTVAPKDERNGSGELKISERRH